MTSKNYTIQLKNYTILKYRQINKKSKAKISALLFYFKLSLKNYFI